MALAARVHHEPAGRSSDVHLTPCQCRVRSRQQPRSDHRERAGPEAATLHDFGRIPVHSRARLARAAPGSVPDGRGVEREREPSDQKWLGGLIGGALGAAAGFAVAGPVGAVVGGIGGAALGAGIAGRSCPVPVAVRNGPRHAPIDTADAAGMAIAITLTSSSGTDADMASVQDSEQVSTSFNHTGSYAAVPAGRSNNSGYMAGYPIPDDRHSEPKARIIDCADNHGGDGSMDRHQLDSFTAPACGITTPRAIPNSGYLIRRRIIVHGTQIRFRLEKSPAACTVNGVTSTAGPSPMQSEEVVVRA
jgi:outer membrane lipoprotein SlyB